MTLNSGSGSVTTVSSATVDGRERGVSPRRIRWTWDNVLTCRREESDEEDEATDEGSQTHYGLGVPYLTGMEE